MQAIKKGLVYALFAALVVTQLYPLFWLLAYSLKTNEEILSGDFFALPAAPRWANYVEAFNGGNYMQYLGNSVVVTAITMVAVIVLSAMAAYAVSRFKWRFGGVVMIIFLLGLMIPIQATLLPLMLVFKNVDILNTHLSLILPYIAFATPISVFILSGFMSSIDRKSVV